MFRLTKNDLLILRHIVCAEIGCIAHLTHASGYGESLQHLRKLRHVNTSIKSRISSLPTREETG